MSNRFGFPKSSPPNPFPGRGSQGGAAEGCRGARRNRGQGTGHWWCPGGHGTLRSLSCPLLFRWSIWEPAWCCSQMHFRGPGARWSQTRPKCQSLEWRKVYCRAVQGDRWLMPPKIPNSPKAFSKAFLKARWGRCVVGGCKLLDTRIFCPHRSDHNVPLNLHWKRCYSVSATFSLHRNGKMLYS